MTTVGVGNGFAAGCVGASLAEFLHRRSVVDFEGVKHPLSRPGGA